MTGLRDAKRITTREDDTARRLAHGLVAVIAILTAYSCVDDIPSRTVVGPATVTMTRVEFDRAIAQARMDAARLAMEAKECGPGDEFRYPPRAVRRYAQKGPL